MICRTRKELMDARPRQAFISYAHVEEPWKKRLVDALSPLQREGIVEAWHDGMLLPGDRWDAKILSALADADLVLLLVSRAFLESEYARETEVPLAVERAQSGHCRLVPIILESCDWTKQPFARYQALPGDRAPLAERSDSVDALNDCLERLRWVFFPPRADSGGDAPGKAVHRLPLLRVTFDFAGPGWPDWSALIEEARKASDNRDVRTNCAQRVAEGSAGKRWEWMLEGPRDAFAAVEAAHKEGRLSGALGVEVVSVGRTVGASYFAGTYVTGEGEAPPPIDRLAAAGSPFTPPLLFGIAVRPSEPDYLQPFFTKNGNDLSDADWQREKEKLLGYFYTVLAVPGEDMHVNLSAFEAGRVMPANLARTGLGRLMGEQDCLLKQVTASMLHPRDPRGKEFWARIEDLARRSGKPGELEMWQKVWIVAGAATLNVKAAGEAYEHPLPSGFEIRREDLLGHISECSLQVMCETDYLALQKRSEESRLSMSPDDRFHEDALEIFRETILPALVEEVNTGSHFAPLRQAYWTLALAKWYRERLAARGLHTRLIGKAAEIRKSLGDSTEIGPGPDAPEWMNECYARYQDLLECVFRVAQPDPEARDTNRLRVYHSGGVSFPAGCGRRG
jgi:hypothetical protein